MIDNERIRPVARRSEELARNPALMSFPLAALHMLPPAIHHTLVCLSVNHYIHSLPTGSDKSIATGNRSKIYQHRGAAIRALSQYVGKDRTRCNDLSISSILVFMSMEVSALHAPSSAIKMLNPTAPEPAHGRLAFSRRRPDPPHRNARWNPRTLKTITLPAPTLSVFVLQVAHLT
jgi:hypothetical protein